MPNKRTFLLRGHHLKKFNVQVKRIILLILSGLWIAYGIFAVLQKNAADFSAFFGAAKSILAGINPYRLYETSTGGFSGFQSPLWLAYFFIPLTVFRIDSALIIYKFINLGISITCLLVILKWQKSKAPFLVVLYLLGCILVLSANTMLLGQVTIIQLAFAILIIHALEQKRPFLAGLALPFILIKPHLVIFFLIAAFRRGGRKMLVSGIIATLIFVLFTFLMRNTWVTEMISQIIFGQQSSTMPWNKFVTISGLFSFPPSLNILVSILVLPLLLILDNKFRLVPNKIWLPIALTLSLATTPYAFAYDLPLIVPALIWLCFPWSQFSFIVILAVTLLTIFSGFSAIAYITVIFIAILSVRKLFLQEFLKADQSKSPSSL